MNLRMLEEFVEFSKALNFSTAAKLLHMSQSSLSAPSGSPSCREMRP